MALYVVEEPNVSMLSVQHAYLQSVVEEIEFESAPKSSEFVPADPSHSARRIGNDQISTKVLSTRMNWMNWRHFVKKRWNEQHI